MRRAILKSNENKPPGRTVAICKANGHVLMDKSRGGLVSTTEVTSSTASRKATKDRPALAAPDGLQGTIARSPASSAECADDTFDHKEKEPPGQARPNGSGKQATSL